MAKITAHIDNPNISGCIYGLFEFESEEIADAKINQIKKTFDCSTKQESKDQYGITLRLWIKDFEVTDQEHEKGFIGSFGIIYKIEREGKWSLKLKKVEVPLKNHPQKARPKV